MNSIKQELISIITEQVQKGKNKYGGTLDEKDLSPTELIDHAIREAIDFSFYLLALKRKLEAEKEVNPLYVKPQFKHQKAIYPEALASTTAGTPTNLSINGPVTVHCTTGELYINASTAATTANSYKLQDTPGHNELDIYIPSSLSILGASTTAKYQAILWEL